MEENPSKSRRMARTLCDLPSDIIINILSRLPVKSLMRFRCLCKSWQTLFTDPNFINTHLNQASANNKNGYVLVKSQFGGQYNFSLHCGETFVEQTRLELPFKRISGILTVEGCYNGLLCLYRTSRSKSNIYLWNPSIRKLKTLPTSFLRCDGFGRMYLSLCFLPHINDYRVIKFLYDGGGGDNDDDDDFPGVKVPPKVEIYSLRRNSWKEIQNVVPCKIRPSLIDPIMNGVTHWLAHMEKKEDPYYEFILSFDLANEVFGELKLPEFLRDVYVLRKEVMVVKESLSLFVYYQDGGKNRVDIWVMKEYGAAESWTEHFSFNHDFLLPLGFMKNGEVVLQDCDGELVSYDPRVQVQQVKDLQFRGPKGLVFVFTYYIESLVLLNEGN